MPERGHECGLAVPKNNKKQSMLEKTGIWTMKERLVVPVSLGMVPLSD